jgi:uncharacterized lipoprotein YmbA
MIRNSFLVIVLLGLMACGSNPVEDHYYSLVLAADDVMAPVRSEERKAQLIVGPIQLPEYLNRRGLAMQIDSNQIQTANHHFWAEPLEEAIGRWTDPGDCRLRIEFDKFHATDRSRVVSSGRYWISSADSDVRQEFDVTESISADGHAHAVAALRRSLGTLGKKGVEPISQILGERVVEEGSISLSPCRWFNMQIQIARMRFDQWVLRTYCVMCIT